MITYKFGFIQTKTKAMAQCDCLLNESESLQLQTYQNLCEFSKVLKVKVDNLLLFKFCKSYKFIIFINLFRMLHLCGSTRIWAFHLERVKILINLLTFHLILDIYWSRSPKLTANIINLLSEYHYHTQILTLSICYLNHNDGDNGYDYHFPYDHFEILKNLS